MTKVIPLNEEHFISRLVTFTYPTDSRPDGPMEPDESMAFEIRRVLNAIRAVDNTVGVGYSIDRYDATRLMNFLSDLSIKLFGLDGTKEVYTTKGDRK